MGRGGCFYPMEDRVFTINELKRLMGLPMTTFDWNLQSTVRKMWEDGYSTNLQYLSQSIYENVLKPTKDVK